jgi:hypothetical protein
MQAKSQSHTEPTAKCFTCFPATTSHRPTQPSASCVRTCRRSSNTAYRTNGACPGTTHTASAPHRSCCCCCCCCCDCCCDFADMGRPFDARLIVNKFWDIFRGASGTFSGLSGSEARTFSLLQEPSESVACRGQACTVAEVVETHSTSWRVSGFRARMGCGCFVTRVLSPVCVSTRKTCRRGKRRHQEFCSFNEE